jgi:tetratricopeptide (TPR) repeat protein
MTIPALDGCHREASVRDVFTSVPYRRIESRVTGGLAYKPLKRLQRDQANRGGDDLRLRAAAAEAAQAAARVPSIENTHAHGVAELIAGNDKTAARLMEEAIGRETDEPVLLAAIRKSNDIALLTDLAAAEYMCSVRDDGEALLAAIEAAERAWRLRRSPEAGWDRALAIERLGVTRSATRAWNEYLEVETSSEWRTEAGDRLRALQRRSDPPTPDPQLLADTAISEELRGIALQDAQRFFETELTAAADDPARLPRLRLIGARIGELFGERLDIDTAQALSRRGASLAGIRAYASGNFVQAEQELGRERNPFAMMARYQRVRGDCTAGGKTCLSDIRSLMRDLEVSKRSLWLSARCSGMEGQALWHRGKIFDAVTAFERALHELERLHDDAGAAWTHIQLANALATAGERELSLRHQLASLRWYAIPGDDRRRQAFEGSALYFLRDDALAAAGLMIDDLRASPGGPESRVMAFALGGMLHARLHDSGAAAEFREANALLGETAPGDRERLQAFLQVLEVGSRRYAAERSIGELAAIVARYESTPESVWLPQLLLERGAALERAGDANAASADYERSMSLLEARQPRVDRLLIGAEMTSEAQTAFDRAIRLLLRQQRIAGALAVAERAAALRISSVFAESSGLHDAYRVTRRPAVDLVDVQRLLGPSEQIVVYHLLHDSLITWTMSSTEIVGFRKSLRGAELAAASHHLRACIAGGDCRSGERERISAALLSPWLQRTRRGATLIFVPPAELGAVPFAFLSQDGQPLIERNAIAVATNLRVFVDAAASDRTRTAPLSALFVAAAQPASSFPPLPLAAREAADAAQNYANHQVIARGTRENFLAAASRYSLIHFAGHALVDEQQPLRSALVFNDEMLYVHELSASSFARARMIVLSACSTGREPRPTMSIATALLRQEVPSVVYTLWAVSDEAAAAFARPFHRSLARGRTRAEAVRDAQLEMLHRGDPPVAWAAFQIAGAPGPMVP